MTDDIDIEAKKDPVGFLIGDNRVHYVFTTGTPYWGYLMDEAENMWRIVPPDPCAGRRTTPPPIIEKPMFNNFRQTVSNDAVVARLNAFEEAVNYYIYLTDNPPPTTEKIRNWLGIAKIQMRDYFLGNKTPRHARTINRLSSTTGKILSPDLWEIE